eukprot:jgi/Mesen1/430/ME000100S10664
MIFKGTSAVGYVAAGWGLFTGSHLLMSHGPVREKLVSTLGEGPFKGLYSAVSLASFIPTTYIYGRYAKGKGVIPWWTETAKSNPVVRTAGQGLKLLGAITMAQSIAAPNPVAELNVPNADKSSLNGSRCICCQVEVRGITRVARHPLFTSTALLGLGQLCTRGHAGDVVYWAGFPILWYVGCLHQDQRQRAVLPKQFYDETSLMPFGAIIEGRNSLKQAVKEFDKPALAACVIAPLFML